MSFAVLEEYEGGKKKARESELSEQDWKRSAIDFAIVAGD